MVSTLVVLNHDAGPLHVSIDEVSVQLELPLIGPDKVGPCPERLPHLSFFLCQIFLLFGFRIVQRISASLHRPIDKLDQFVQLGIIKPILWLTDFLITPFFLEYFSHLDIIHGVLVAFGQGN